MGSITDSNATNTQDELYISDLVNVEVVQAEIIKSGAGVTAYANINDTIIGNLEERKTVRIYNRGKKIRWRIVGQLTGTDGEDIGKGEALEFTYGDQIVIEIREQNNSNELDVIITEAK